MQQTVGISQMIVSTSRDDVLVTYSLGSCIGVTLYDPIVPVGGMVHCMLPLSQLDPAKALKCPAMFTDTGVALLLRAMLDAGAQKKRIIAKVAGAANIMDEKGTFNIGQRNYVVLRKILWKNNMLLAAEDVGGPTARTLYLHIDTGLTIVRSRGMERALA